MVHLLRGRWEARRGTTRGPPSLGKLSQGILKREASSQGKHPSPLITLKKGWFTGCLVTFGTPWIMGQETHPYLSSSGSMGKSWKWHRERASPVPEAVPGTLAIVAGLLIRMRRFKREVLQMRKHGPGHRLESSDGNSGALVTAQGGQLSCRTVT